MLIASAIVRLTPLALDTFSHRLSVLHWTALVSWILFMLYSEGYRGFQQGFSPRVAARALHLRQHPRLLHVVLAPLHCMGLIHATRRRLIGSWTLVTMIVVFIVAVQQLAQPWRGIVDSGVVAGLGWGLASLMYFTYRAFSKSDFSYPADIPET